MPDVTYQHKDFPEFLERAELVDDVVQNRVKKKGEKYLPRPNPTDKTEDNRARYKQYLERAFFYNATGYTRRGLLGAAFMKPPTLTLSSGLEYVESDIDGEGNGIVQHSRSTLGDILAKGRRGLLVDYPQTTGSQTRADLMRTGIRASTLAIDACRIVNWRTRKIGSEHVLELVVYQDDHYEITADGFGMEKVAQYRALALDEDGLYYQQRYRKDKSSGKWVEHEKPILPTRGDGARWTRIPFIFCGSESNDPAVDMSPLYDIAVVNIGHYRNTADLEDSAYFVGQPQPWAAGLDESWLEVLKEKGFKIGSRILLPLPEGGSFGMEQAEPNNLVGELQERKEAQMIQLGARLLERGGAAKTATQEVNETTEQHSVLSLAAENVSKAYEQCLGWMHVFNNTTGEDVYEISQEYTRPNLDAQMLTALVGAWQSGKYPTSDLWTQLRKYGLIDPEKTDEQIQEELDGDPTGLALDE